MPPTALRDLEGLPLRRSDERRGCDDSAKEVAHGGWTRRGREGFIAPACGVSVQYGHS